MRARVYAKCDGHCAYCGKEITLKQMQVDHIIPRSRYNRQHNCLVVNSKAFTEYGLEDERNLNPSCVRCNLWKRTFTVEEFRKEIKAQVHRLRERSSGFRLAEDFGLIIPGKDRIVFYYERLRIWDKRSILVHFKDTRTFAFNDTLDLPLCSHGVNVVLSDKKEDVTCRACLRKLFLKGELKK
jgi:hypothetical protein